MPISFAKHHHVLPFKRDGDRLEVAISDPLLTDPLDDMRMLFAGARCEPVLVTRRAILNCINHVYDQASSAEDVAEEFAEADLADIASELISEPEDLLDSSEESAPIIRLVNSLLQQAVKERASDIHIQPGEKDLVVRFRIDNILHEPIRPLPRRMQQAITTRIKIMGRLDIAEKRLPQDGRIVLKIAGRDYDVRLSTLPTQYGERCVLRLLPRTQELLSIEKIGLSGGAPGDAAQADPPQQRDHPGHRPDRLGQDQHAVRGARRHQQARTRTSSRSRTRSRSGCPASARSR